MSYELGHGRECDVYLVKILPIPQEANNKFGIRRTQGK